MFIRDLFGHPDPYLCIKAEGFQGKAALLLCCQQPCVPRLRCRWGHQPEAPCQLSSSLWHHLPPASPGPPCSLLEQVWCAKIIQQLWTSHIPRALQPPPGRFPTQLSALLCFSSIAGGEGFSTSFWHFRDATWYVNWHCHFCYRSEQKVCFRPVPALSRDYHVPVKTTVWNTPWMAIL